MLKTIEGNLSHAQLENWLDFIFRNDATSCRTLLPYIEAYSLSTQDIIFLPGKKILLVGGGRSPIKKNLRDFGLGSVIVDNIDPYCDFFEKNCDNLISQDFFTYEATDKYDEVWAAFSFPAYSKSNWEVQSFYPKAMKMLKPGGTLRVTGVTLLGQVNMGLSKQPNMSLDQKFFDDFKKYIGISVGYQEKYFPSLLNNFNQIIPHQAYTNTGNEDISGFIHRYFQFLPHFKQDMVSKDAPLVKSFTFRAPNDKDALNCWLESYIENIPKLDIIFSEAKIIELFENQMIIADFFKGYMETRGGINPDTVYQLDKKNVIKKFREQNKNMKLISIHQLKDFLNKK
jgi:hypothetical protein